MEEAANNFSRPSSTRALPILKAALSGRSSPRHYSPSLRRLNSTRIPRRESRTGRFPWIRNNRVVFWLLLITLWAYIGFHVQSQWAHGDHGNKAGFVGYRSESHTVVSNATEQLLPQRTNDLAKVSAVRRGRQVSEQKIAPRKRGRRSRRTVAKLKEVLEVDGDRDLDGGGLEEGLFVNGSFVGPFDKMEESVLGWIPEKRKGTCDRKGEFARIIWSRHFMLVFHELSMTGAPLSMMELGSELLSCGAYVSAVVLSMRGGLMAELDRRGIKVLKDKADLASKLP